MFQAIICAAAWLKMLTAGFATHASLLPPTQKVLFEVTDYSDSPTPYLTIVELEAGQPIDLTVFSKHFYIPRQLPDAFIDHKHRNETVTKWRDDSKAKEIKDNWFYTFAYDNQSRLTSYTYSGCMICSNFAYNYQVKYNTHNQPISITNIINMHHRYEIHYAKDGRLQWVASYDQSNHLEKLVRVAKK